MRWIPLLLLSLYGGSSLAKDIFCSGDVQTPCLAELCYDSINLKDGRITSGCANATECTQTGCKLSRDKFLCCCAGSTCNGKSAGLLRARLHQYQEQKPFPQILKSDKTGRLNPRDVVSSLSESQQVAEPSPILYTDETAVNATAIHEQSTVENEQNIEMKDAVNFTVTEATETLTSAEITKMEQPGRTEEATSEPISEEEKPDPFVQNPSDSVSVKIVEQPLPVPQAINLLSIDKTIGEETERKIEPVKVEAPNKYEKESESEINNISKTTAAVVQQQETTTQISIQQMSESEELLSSPQKKPQTDAKNPSESTTERPIAVPIEPGTSTTQELTVTTSPEMITVFVPEIKETTVGGSQEHEFTANLSVEVETTPSLLSSFSSSSDVTRTPTDEENSEEDTSDADNVFFTVPKHHNSDAPTENSELHEMSAEENHPPIDSLLEKDELAHEAATNEAEKQSPERNDDSADDSLEEEILEKKEEDDEDASEYYPRIQTGRAMEKQISQEIVEKKGISANVPAVESNDTRNLSGVKHGRNLSTKESEEDDSGEPLSQTLRNPASPAIVEESSVSGWWIAAALALIGLAGVVFLITKKTKKPVRSSREQELILVDPLLKEKNEKIANETPSVA